MMKSFTLAYLESHTYEEVEREGKRRGLWEDASPRESRIRTIFSYSRALTVIQTSMLGSFNFISN